MEPAARKIGLSNIIRVSSTVRSVVASSKPGTSRGTSDGARTKSRIASSSSTPSMRLSTVEATRQARGLSPCSMSPERTGMSAEVMAPAATSSKMRSGMRKAA